MRQPSAWEFQPLHTHVQGGGGGNTLSQLGRAVLALNPDRSVYPIGGGGQPMDEDSIAMVRARRHQTWFRSPSLHLQASVNSIKEPCPGWQTYQQHPPNLTA